MRLQGNYVAVAEALLDRAIDGLDPAAQLTQESRRDMVMAALVAALLALVNK